MNKKPSPVDTECRVTWSRGMGGLSGPWQLRIEDARSGVLIFEGRFDDEAAGQVFGGMVTTLPARIYRSPDVGRWMQHDRLRVPWLSSDEWRRSRDEAETEGLDLVDIIMDGVRRWVFTEHTDMWEAGWRPDTVGPVFNGHRWSESEGGYEIVVRRWVDENPNGGD